VTYGNVINDIVIMTSGHMSLSYDVISGRHCRPTMTGLVWPP